VRSPTLLAGAFAVTIAMTPAVTGGAECAPPSGSVRVMLHDADIIASRLALYAKAADSPTERVAALRKLFEAAGCPQVLDHGDGKKDRSVECTVPGAGTDTIVVGVGQSYDSAGSPPLLSSLQEALAAAPRRHTFRWIAFSSHETKEERTKLVQKPKGATRVLDAMSDAERDLVRTMVHIGPIGFGPVWTHPPSADDRLKCAFEAAAGMAGVERGETDHLVRDCSSAGPGWLECEEAANWAGGNDWLPFRRSRVPVFGIHTGAERKVGGRLDGGRYFATYRMLAIFLALADEVLAARAAPVEAPSAGAATSPR
jgi:hypothetical protein